MATTLAPATRQRIRARVPRGLFGWAVPFLGTVLIIALFQVLIMIGVISDIAMPLPTMTIKAFVNELSSATFWVAIGDTLKGWAIALSVATVLAIPLGIAAGTSLVVFRSMRLVVDFLRPIPSVALLPLLILVLGIAMPLKITMGALVAFFPLFFATMYGVQDVDPVTRDTAVSYRLNGVYRFFYISLPGATPYIATGMRLSASVALLLTVGVEMIVGLPGIGRAIYDAQYANDLPAMYALVAASGVLGVLIALVFKRVEKRALRWHPSQIRELA